MGRIAFIYPGQGAQVCGMGQEFYEHTEVGKATFDLATELLGFSMPELCFTENDRLDITEYTQAAMVTTSIAMTKILEEHGIKPDVAAGLSLGEYCALYAAGVISDRDAIATVRHRGILMQQEVPVGQGAMAAVLSMDAAAIEDIIAGIQGVQIANYNCPGQIVISGTADAVARAEEAWKQQGGRASRLATAGAFHSPMMAEAAQQFGQFLATVPFAEPVVPLVCNTDAALVDAATVRQRLVDHLTHTVLFSQSVQRLCAAGASTFVEVGFGGVLSGLVKRIDKEAARFCVQDSGSFDDYLAQTAGV